jgi:NADH-quinone oxidoreductase subunit C
MIHAMTPAQIAQKIQDRFGAAITAAFPHDKHPRVHTTAAHWRPLAEALRSDPEMGFDWLACITALDYVVDNQLAASYDLFSMGKGHWFSVKVYVDRDDPHIASVMDLWPAADWHEREAYDLMGILFDGHRDLRRILLAEDWVGHPLRKDYVFPREYHGIPGTYELDWQQQPDYPK